MQSQKFILEKAYSYKLFMLVAFLLFAAVMYQGHIQQGGIYSILFFATLALCAFQIASIFYVTFIKRTLKLTINNNKISWSFFDNSKQIKEKTLNINDIKKAAAILKDVLANKPEKNKWSDEDSTETSTRAFYETGG